MAGSRRSPGLRDEWRIAQDNSARGRDFARGRDRATEQSRGRNRQRGRHRPGGPDRRSRSPLSSRLGPPSGYDDPSKRREPPPGTSLPSREIPPNHRRPSFSSSYSFATNQDAPRFQEIKDQPIGKLPAQDEEFEKFSRNRSPRAPRRERNRKNRNAARHPRGQPNQRGKPSKRERFREGNFQGHSYESGGPERAGFRRDPGERTQRSISPASAYEDYHERGQSHHSFESRRSRSLSMSPNRDGRMSSNRRQSETTDFGRSPSPSRPLDPETRDNFHASESFPRRGMANSKQQSNPRHPPSHPRLDGRQYSSPQFMASNSSYHGSPEPGSPRSGGRGGRNNQSGNLSRHG
jgi:CTD kinase subunit alpha